MKAQECVSVIENLPGIHEVLGLISSTGKIRRLYDIGFIFQL
jgi:hypothetical protein